MGNIHPSINRGIHVTRIFSKKIINFKIQIDPVDVELLQDDGHGSSLDYDTQISIYSSLFIGIHCT